MNSSQETYDESDNTTVAEPTTERRKYIRIEIESPAALGRIKDIFGNFWPNCDEYPVNGSILNISAGGVLLDLEEPVNENDIVALRFHLRGSEPIQGVLGIVKRCESDEAGNLAGIRFVNREKLNDHLAASEVDLLSPDFCCFGSSVEDAINQRLQQAQV